MSEEAFHRTRRMFVRKTKTFLVAAPGSPLSHEDWFATYKDSGHWMRSFVRGFYDLEAVYIYIQTDASKWDVTQKVIDEAPMIVHHLYMMKVHQVGDPKFHVLDGLPVYGGMVPGALGTRWTPKTNLGLFTGPCEYPGPRKN